MGGWSPAGWRAAFSLLPTPPPPPSSLLSSADARQSRSSCCGPSVRLLSFPGHAEDRWSPCGAAFSECGGGEHAGPTMCSCWISLGDTMAALNEGGRVSRRWAPPAAVRVESQCLRAEWRGRGCPREVPSEAASRLI